MSDGLIFLQPRGSELTAQEKELLQQAQRQRDYERQKKRAVESALRILHYSPSQTLSPIPHSLATSGPTALFGSEIQNILLQ